ncbi:MAG: efflux RND transporter periplasmic adaptor subunit [Opitutales bacterium]|nr:efflux RND transporter periplasmic adaptor subunit [Opitutales bacterium]
MRKFIISALSIVGVLALSVGVYAGLMATKKKPEKKEAETKHTLVEVFAASYQSISVEVASQGTVLPRTETTLFPEVGGEIIEVSPHLYAGGYFEEGEILLKIDPSNYEVAVSSAEAQLARAEVTLAQEQALAEQALKDWVALGNTAEEASSLVLREPQLKEAEANVRSAKAALARAERDLSKTEIKAPYEGMVRARMSDLGQVVNQGTSLASIFAVDFVEVRLPLTAEDIQFLDLPRSFRPSDVREAGPAVELISRFGKIDESWQGTLVRTEGTIDPRTRVLYAVAKVEDPYGIHSEESGSVPMSVGMFVEASIQGKTYDHITVVPRFALRGKNQVLVVDEENLLRRRDVEILRTDPKFAYISEGIDEGEKICLTALEYVVEGMPVEAVEVTDQFSYLEKRAPRYTSL